MVDTRWTTIIKEFLIAEYSDDVLGRRKGIKNMNRLRLNLAENALFREEFKRLETKLIGKTEQEIDAIKKQWQQEIDEQKRLQNKPKAPGLHRADDPHYLRVRTEGVTV